MSGRATLRPLHEYRRLEAAEMRRRAAAFREELQRRRTVRDYAPGDIDDEVLRDALLAAGSAPSGANRQPWHFVVVRDAALRRRIREAAEREERAFYATRAGEEWLNALAPLGTGPEKPFLEEASALIAIFAQRHQVAGDGTRRRNYYVTESVGIATGLLIAALHHAGLATLTHTPAPMDFLGQLLERPAHEKPFLLLVVGYPSPDAQVPDIRRRPLAEIATFR